MLIKIFIIVIIDGGTVFLIDKICKKDKYDNSDGDANDNNFGNIA